jgi:hypothetical protein
VTVLRFKTRQRAACHTVRVKTTAFMPARHIYNALLLIWVDVTSAFNLGWRCSWAFPALLEDLCLHLLFTFLSYITCYPIPPSYLLLPLLPPTQDDSHVLTYVCICLSCRGGDILHRACPDIPIILSDENNKRKTKGMAVWKWKNFQMEVAPMCNGLVVALCLDGAALEGLSAWTAGRANGGTGMR